MTDWIFFDLDEFTKTYRPILNKLRISVSEAPANFSSKQNYVILSSYNWAIDNEVKLKEQLKPEDILVIVGGHNLLDSREFKGPSIDTNIIIIDNDWSPTAIELSMIQINRVAMELQEKDFEQDEFERIDENLSVLVEQVQEQIDRVKKLHEKTVPKKRQDINGVQLRSKYLAGTNSGGEILEFTEINHHAFFIIFHSSSYLGTAKVIPLISNFIKNDHCDDKYLKDFNKQIQDEFKGGEILNSYILGAVNTHNLKCYIHAQGENIIVYGDKVINTIDKDGQYEYQLGRGNELLLLSRGIVHNYHNLGQLDYILKNLAKQTSKSQDDKVEDLFKNMKKSSESKFLDYDSSVISIQVSKDVIIEV